MQKHLRFFLKTSAWQQIIFIFLAVLAALAAGIAGIFYPSPFSPLIVAAGLAGLVFFLVAFRKPILALYLALFISVLPIGLLPDEIHSFLNRSLTFFALAAWMFDFIIHRRPILWTIPTLLMLGFLVWGAITLFWADYLDIGMKILQTYVQRFILFFLLLLNEIKTKANLYGVMRILSLTGWVIVLASAVTLLNKGYTPGTRFELFDVNENDLGVTLIVTLAGVLWDGLNPENSRKPLIKLAALLFLLFASGLIFISGSRGSAISLALILFVFAFWKPTRPWVFLILFILVLSFMFVPAMFTTTIDRFVNEAGDSILGGREALWQAGLQLLSNHFWVGAGIGNAPYTIKNLLLNSHVMGHESVSLHNPLLTIWSETGVPGIMLYLGTVACAVLLMARSYREKIRSGFQHLIPYYWLVTVIFIGYLASWVKGGGMEMDSSFFLLIVLLLVPIYIKDG